MNEFSPSELIYLYVDGEADASQQAALFAALAHDNELQAEFNDAFALRLSASTEVRKTVPAPALKSSLFQKAGFSAGSVAGAATSVAPIASAVPSAATSTGLMAGVKGMLLPLLTAISGIFMFATGAVLWYSSTDVSPDASRIVEQTDVLATTPSAPDAVQFPAATDDVSAFNGNTASIQPEVGISNQPSTFATSRRMVAENSEHRMPQYSSTRERMGEGVQSWLIGGTDESNLGEQSILPARRSPVTHVSSRMPEQDVAIAASTPVEMAADIGDVRSMFPAYEISSFSWGVTARGIIGLRLFPWREMGTASDVLDNTVIGAAWMINDEHSAGVEIGREVLPMFVLGSDGKLHETQSLMWGGVAYRYSPEVIQLSEGLRPYLSGFAGGSVSGPLLKSSVGLLWKPDTHIQFTLGAEGTFLMYRYRQQWYGTQKLGVSYGVTIAFP